MPDKVTRIKKVSSKNDITCVDKNAAEEGKIVLFKFKAPYLRTIEFNVN